MPLKLIEISCFLLLQLQVECLSLAERAGNIHTISLHRAFKNTMLWLSGDGLKFRLSPQNFKYAPVAQLDRVPDFESVGRRFESCRAHHILAVLTGNDRFGSSGEVQAQNFQP